LEVSEYWTSNYTTSHSNKRNIVWAQKQTWRPVEQNRRPRNKTTQLQPSDLWQRSQKHTQEKDSLFNKCAGKTGYLHSEDWNKTCFSHPV
jgi:hypothetical protein